MRTIGAAERRARLGVRHHLARPVRTVEQAADDLVGLHSSDPATVFLSAWARVRNFAVADLERALYDSRSLVRMLGMRRTLFVVPVDLAAVMHEACTKALVPRERTRLTRMLQEQGIADDAETWLDDVARRTLEAIEAHGEAAAAELTADVPELGARLAFGEGKTWGGTMGVSTRVLFLLASEATVVRARPRGRWTSGQYRWAPTDRWLGGALPRLDHDEACASLLSRWLRSFGPVTLTDIRWWTGWTAREARAALAAVEAVEVALDSGAGYLMPDDLEPVAQPEPWVALLPGLDPTVMGWKERGWYLGGHAPRLFDRNGNAGPTVWANGRVVGGWGQGEDGEVVTTPLETIDADLGAMIEAERAQLTSWLGEVRIRPRFRTPLERERSG